MNKKYIRLAVILFLALPIPLFAADAPDIAKLREAAEKGDANAQLQLFTAYCSGNGVPQDKLEAEKWLHKAQDAAAKTNAGKSGPEQGWGLPIRDGCKIKYVQ